MNIQLSKTPIGLDGVPAAETVLSHVDGERGELIIAGERVGDIARKTGFEGVTARLWVERRHRPADRRGRGAGRLGRRAASAPLRGCRICSALRGDFRWSMDFVPRSPACARKRG